MIKAIGFQKIMLLLILMGLVAGMYFYDSSILKPEILKVKRQLSENKSEISKMTSDLGVLVNEMQQFEVHKGEFNRLQQTGFFDSQDRVATKRRLAVIQNQSGVLSARYSIKAANNENDPKAKDAGFNLVSTQMDFTVEALTDNDVYNFIHLLNYGFPGHVIVSELSVERIKEVTQPLLRKIGAGDYEPLVKATFKVEWRTLIPDTSVEVREGQ